MNLSSKFLIPHIVTEVRGWRKTGRPNTTFNPSRTESSRPLLTELLDTSFNPSRIESSRPLLTELPDSSFNPSQIEPSRPSLTELPDSSSTESKKF